MKKYLDPELNILKFSTTDIIMDSSSNSNQTPTPDNEGWNDFTYPVGPPPRD